MNQVTLITSCSLWIILQYDINKLSVKRKPSKHNSEETVEWVWSQSALKLTNWLMPKLDQCFWDLIRRFEQTLVAGLQHGNTHRRRENTSGSLMRSTTQKR